MIQSDYTTIIDVDEGGGKVMNLDLYQTYADFVQSEIFQEIPNAILILQLLFYSTFIVKGILSVALPGIKGLMRRMIWSWESYEINFAITCLFLLGTVAVSSQMENSINELGLEKPILASKSAVEVLDAEANIYTETARPANEDICADPRSFGLNDVVTVRAGAVSGGAYEPYIGSPTPDSLLAPYTHVISGVSVERREARLGTYPDGYFTWIRFDHLDKIECHSKN